MALQDAALKDDYFLSRKLAPNGDFWRSVHIFAIKLNSDDFLWLNSGLILRAMGEYSAESPKYGSELTNARSPDGLFPLLVSRAPCCGVARTLAPGAYVLAAVRSLLMLNIR
jgi:hypothetical protein